MESPHQASQIIGRLLLVAMLLSLVWAFLSQNSSAIVKRLSLQTSDTIQLHINTKPLMMVSYDPATLKAHITVLPPEESCTNKKKKCTTPNQPGRFFTPKQTHREQFWEDFKFSLRTWRFNPLLAVQVCWDYLTAWHEKRTNISPAEFVLLSLELMKLEPSDFSIKLPPPSKKKSQRKTTPEPVLLETPQKDTLSAQDRPLILEIFNASGKKGIAQELTQYLRTQNEKGLLRVDVFQYENYPSVQQTSWLEDYSGRLADVKQLGHTLGINSEIRTGSSSNVMCDTRIIIGKDFKMPL